MKKISLTNDKRTKGISLTTERAEVNLKKLQLSKDGKLISISPNQVSVEYNMYGKTNQSGVISIPYADDNIKELIPSNPITTNWADVSRIDFTLHLKNYEPGNYNLTIFYEDFSYINDEKVKENFYEHLTKPKNHNILFSAPFGEGKSTFLDYFFKQNHEEFEVFKVFPVNYSVASNEDIFKYIKADILLQLMEKGVVFDKNEFSHLETTQQFILNNPKNIVRNLFRTGLSLSQNTNHLVKAIEEFENFCKEYQDYRSKLKTDDQAKAVSYVQKLYEEEGSLFEDNFYTQLIRQLVNRVKEKPERKTVLVIDDLDRMDPDHIFRILNVISAQCDSFNLGNDQFNNKFGFDHIVVVCDIDNIRHIFEHRYGEKVKFDGYINKFYSSKIFRFNGSILVDFVLDSIENKLNNKEFKESLILFKIFCEIGLLTPRDLIKSFGNIDLDWIYRIKYGHYNPIIKQKIIDIKFWPLLHNIKEFYGKEYLLSKLNYSIDSQVLTKNLSLLCGQLMIGLISKHPSESSEYYVTLKNRRFKVGIGTNMREEYIKELHLTQTGAPDTKYKFKESDFYELLIENIKLL